MVPLDPLSLVRASDDEFRIFVERLERAFHERAATLTVDDDSGLVVVAVFDLRRLKIPRKEWESFTHNLYHAAQIIFYAAEAAPPNAISRWAAEYDEKLVDQAIRRVEELREGAPSLIEIWERRGTLILPSLGSIQYDVIATKTGSQSAILRLSSSSSSPFSLATRPNRHDHRSSITVALEKNDLAYLQWILGKALKELDDGEDQST
jgi:hypothetical protein